MNEPVNDFLKPIQCQKELNTVTGVLDVTLHLIHQDAYKSRGNTNYSVIHKVPKTGLSGTSPSSTVEVFLKLIQLLFKMADDNVVKTRHSFYPVLNFQEVYSLATKYRKNNFKCLWKVLAHHDLPEQLQCTSVSSFSGSVIRGVFLKIFPPLVFDDGAIEQIIKQNHKRKKRSTKSPIMFSSDLVTVKAIA